MSKAKFTVFLPVRNGGIHLPLCVNSILAQSNTSFDLVILENKSTDGTSEWLQSLEKKDSRVRVIPSGTSLSVEENWKRILAVPKNEFMTVIGHDDLLDPDFFDEIARTIENEPEACLYLTHFRLIDVDGKVLRPCKPIPKYETVSEFLAARMAGIRDSFGTGYVMRSVNYDEVGGIPPFCDLLYADDALWIKLMGFSFKVTSQRVCFSYRLHSGSISGKPNNEALFRAFVQYLIFLKKISECSEEITEVMGTYGSQYVASRCQNYYSHLLRVTSFGKPLNDIDIKALLGEFSPETILVGGRSRFFRRLVKILGIRRLAKILGVRRLVQMLCIEE
ncbi:MAG: glycosyltransferase family 2 protein [Proteobacteria bacterium]|nr:glycosyltransferase family 2 protein [Pseudomonadota bacterium]